MVVNRLFAPQARWYANARKGTYHLEAPDWVRTGRALCGANIAKPGWTTGSDYPAPHLHACATCVKEELAK